MVRLLALWQKTSEHAQGVNKVNRTLANYSRFVRPGWKLMEVESPGLVNTGFVSPEGRDFVIVAVNDGAGGRSVNYEFGEAILRRVEAHRTGPVLDLGAVPAPRREAHRFTAELPASTVTTFVGELVR